MSLKQNRDRSLYTQISCNVSSNVFTNVTPVLLLSPLFTSYDVLSDPSSFTFRIPVHTWSFMTRLYLSFKNEKHKLSDDRLFWNILRTGYPPASSLVNLNWSLKSTFETLFTLLMTYWNVPALLRIWIYLIVMRPDYRLTTMNLHPIDQFINRIFTCLEPFYKNNIQFPNICNWTAIYQVYQLLNPSQVDIIFKACDISNKSLLAQCQLLPSPKVSPTIIPNILAWNETYKPFIDNIQIPRFSKPIKGLDNPLKALFIINYPTEDQCDITSLLTLMTFYPKKTRVELETEYKKCSLFSVLNIWACSPFMIQLIDQVIGDIPSSHEISQDIKSPLDRHLVWFMKKYAFTLYLIEKVSNDQKQKACISESGTKKQKIVPPSIPTKTPMKDCSLHN